MATNTAEAEQLLTKEEVMYRLRCSEPTLYRLAGRSDDPLPSVKVGGLLRFETAELDAWIARQRRGGDRGHAA